ncbi:MAG TPA: ABC transporter permease subunit [Nocardioides sp.]|uniref:ABC transporter permease n=1 Tax=Nocardioides sp. 31GB23 TaxID=3156065 RepID=UPI002FB2816D
MRGNASLRSTSVTLALAGAAGVLLAWWIATTDAGGGGGRIASPLDTATEGWNLLTDSVFWDAAAVTALRGGAGLLLAVMVSVGAAFALARNRFVNAAAEPLVSLLYPVPRVALFPIATLALGFGAAPQISLVALECFFPLTVTLYAGLRSVDRNVIWLTWNADAGRLRTAGITLRLALPSLFTGFRITAPLMLTLAVATQMFTGGSDGLGYLIVDATARLQTATPSPSPSWWESSGSVSTA